MFAVRQTGLEMSKFWLRLPQPKTELVAPEEDDNELWQQVTRDATTGQIIFNNL